MSPRTTILLKLSGESLRDPSTGELNGALVSSLAHQIRELRPTHRFGIVVGGGSFFRGGHEGKNLGISPEAGHVAGMIATMMTGIVVHDFLEQAGVPARILNALTCPMVGNQVTPQAISDCVRDGECIVFVGGLGSPFFTTDTTSIVRALQIGAHEVWKATKVRGIHTADPMVVADAPLIPKLTYARARELNVGIMDNTALALAEGHNLPIRVFSMFDDAALIRAAHDYHHGSILTVKEYHAEI